jgi:hypothetical protein
MTAVEWLKQQYIERGETLPLGVFQEALEKEKEQIVKAFASGWNWNSDPEKYYQENYGQEEDKTFKQKSKWTSVDNTKH